MVGALFGNCGCIFTIGYFQEPLFFAPFRREVVGWLGGALDKGPPPEYPALGPEDIVVHVRCCSHSGGKFAPNHIGNVTGALVYLVTYITRFQKYFYRWLRLALSAFRVLRCGTHVVKAGPVSKEW